MTTERERLLSWAAQMADPNWCLSVPKEAKDVIGKLVDMVVSAPELPKDVVLGFINERTQYVRVCRETTGNDSQEDYLRWQGHMEARRQLAERMGYTVPYEIADRTEPKAAKK